MEPGHGRERKESGSIEQSWDVSIFVQTEIDDENWGIIEMTSVVVYRWLKVVSSEQSNHYFSRGSVATPLRSRRSLMTVSGRVSVGHIHDYSKF